MFATYVPIASTTLSSNLFQIEFSSIPNTYTDLVLVLHPVNYSNGNMSIRFNGDTGNNYSRTAIGSAGGSALSGRVSNFSSVAWDYIGSGINGVGGPVIAHIMSYANTNFFKTVLGSGGHASLGVDRTVSTWRSTSAISSIWVTGPSNFAAGTVVSLYGIKAAQ